MAGTRGRSDPSLEQLLFESPWEFDFFQAVRLLEWIRRDSKPVGAAAAPSEEAVRFGAWLSMAFPASAIQELKESENSSSPPRMTVAFLGLTGIRGVLPAHYTERMLATKNRDEHPLVRFFDLFNHRWTSLFYRAWLKHRPPALYQAAALAGTRPDPFTHALFDLIGMGTAGLRGRMQMFDEPLLRYAGLLSQRPHSAAALKGTLTDHFQVPIAIEQFVGSWYALSDFDLSYLNSDSGRNQLGIGAFLGDRVWDQGGKFRIKIGPVGAARFAHFLPDGDEIEELREITRLFVGTALVFEVQIILAAEDVRGVQLGTEGQQGSRLGWNCWLRTKAFEKDATEAAFSYVT